MNDLSKQPRTKVANVSPARLRRDGGYLLLAIMLTMAFLIIAAMAAAPRMVQQMKRDREEEMIHRGTEYARAIKKFYKKNGRYPATLDDLDKGQIKYLRKRYKDPLTKDGKWKLLNYGDIAMLLNGAAPGTPAAAMGTLGGNGTSAAPGSVFSTSGSPLGSSFSQQPQQQQQQQQQPGAGTTGFPSNSDTGGNSEAGTGGGFTGSDQGFSSSSSSQTTNSNQTGGANGSQSSSPFGSNNTGNGQSFGGGAIVGVASLSKDPTIRIYNKKKTYNEWQFIYNPMMDQQNVLLKGPYQPTTVGSQNIGTPASQMNGQQQNQSPFGQQNSGFGQQNSGFGQQQSTPQSPSAQPQ